MSTSRNRAGFSLAELLAAMVLTAMVGTTLVRSLVSTSRLSQAQAERTAMQSGLRAGAGLLRMELGALTIASTGSDLIAFSNSSITYRAMRTLALACAVSVNSITLRTSSVLGIVSITAYDSLLLFQEGSDTTLSDDSWKAYGVGASGVGACPDGAVATVVTLPPGSLPLMPDSILLDAPVRAFENMLVKVYQSGGRWWLGAASDGEIIQPVLGPLAAPTDVFRFLDGDGTPTTAPSAVRSAEVVLPGETTAAIAMAASSSRELAHDSLPVRVRLRNAP